MKSFNEDNNFPYIEPRMRHILARKSANKHAGPYLPENESHIAKVVSKLFTANGYRDVVVDEVARMAGGASKEQFMFCVKHADISEPKKMVLRMDPNESIAETCRLREFELLAAIANEIPVPKVVVVDAEGDILGQPGLITEFVNGVTKPSDLANISVSGIGTSYGRYSDLLAPQFVNYMAAIHSLNIADKVSTYVMPTANTAEAALYQVDFWAKCWQMDKVESIPLITIATNWLRANAPACDAPCLVHCDFRIGNFMFEEPSGKITAVLDWELAHFGDFHEDIAWTLTQQFGTYNSQGEFYVCGLMPAKKFLAEYEVASGRKIDEQKLHYYKVLNAWKCAIMDMGSAITAAKNQNNHQDILVTWLGSAGGVFLNQIEILMSKG